MLDEIFATTLTIHGVLVEVYGIGVLITGESGVGKSETALELIERGHRLISDDTVKLRNISDTYLIGSGENPMLAHHMEIRGIGILNLANLFGVGSIRDKKQVQLLVHLEEWDSNKNYDRVGEELYETLLGIAVPKLEIPVKPGRNVPIIIETAARNERLKKLGYYSAKEFDQSVLKWLESESARNLYYNNEETF
jgi:HPr kinase/phosphorylase